MSRLRVEELADQLIAADSLQARLTDRKGKEQPRTQIIEEIVPDIARDEPLVSGGPPVVLIGGLIGLLALLLIGGSLAFGLIGRTGATPTPIPTLAAASPTPSASPTATPTPPVASTSPTPSPNPSPTASPVPLVFPPNLVFDGCIVIDPQGNVTFLTAAFTLFNVLPGDYRGAFLVAPGGGLQGSGAATNGANPIVVPMRATAFGVYDKLVVIAPNGAEVDVGPIRQQLPLDLNAQTDVRNACDPSKLMAPTQQTIAGRAYLQAVAPVNAAAAEFAAATANWSNSTTPIQAQTDAAPLLSAFQAIQPQLLVLASAYPPAAEHLMAANDAVSRLIADLQQLGSIGSIGLEPWLQRYQSDLQTLSAASNVVREDLGVQAIVSP